MREEKLMQSIRNATLEEVRKIATMVIKTSMDSDQKIEAITNKITALIERESEQKYTRKQVQEACANAYQRGVDNRPYIEKFDEWVDDERESGWISVDDMTIVDIQRYLYLSYPTAVKFKENNKGLKLLKPNPPKSEEV